ncbi:MAG: type I-U CRISPR-associated protein Csb2 [Planctomycetaceae bacterium]|nr:type I-U CRISPR-associated protein Csb2 [Planctomycetaceae bacterium]
MSDYLCLTVRFLQPYYHGLRDGGEAEWPPSPLRLYQALVAAAAARSHDNQPTETDQSALRWLEQCPLPTVIAPEGTRSTAPYRMYVPNNAADLVAGAWVRGNLGASVAEHRTEKDVQPMHLHGEAVHYLFQSEGEDSSHLTTLRSIARSITHLGWGVDMVVGDGAALSEGEARQLDGERWHPGTGATGVNLRVPVKGTFTALTSKHQAFLRRLSVDGFRPVPPLTAFEVVTYRREFEPPERTVTAFQLLDPEAEMMRAFDTTRHTCRVAGMLRHVTGLAAVEARWDAERVSRVVFGHAGPRDTSDPSCIDPNEEGVISPTPQSADDVVGANRLAYLPLPSLEFRGKGLVVGSIRRALITSLGGNCRDEVRWTQRALSGRDLIGKQDGTSQALLAVIPQSEKMVQNYTKLAVTWSTVTPVILPGRDDRSQRKAERLLRKAIRQAGFSELLAEHAEIEWRNVSFWPGGDLATRFFVPEHLRGYPRFHMRIVWKKSTTETVAMKGPICLGGGRHYGLGLFAAESDRS